MRRIHGKIEALEKAAFLRRKAGEEIVDRALESLSRLERELLISAFGAKRAGRELSPSESAARRAYTQAWQQEVRPRGRAGMKCEYRDHINRAILRELAGRVTLERLELIRAGLKRGGELSAQESEAAEVYVSEREQLCRLAGFTSASELELYGKRTAGGER